MVSKVISLVYKEVRGLHQAAYVLGIFAFGSQLLALVRDRLLAHRFGAGIELDIYYTAFRIPDLMFVLFASTLSVYVLIPFVAERVRNDKNGGAKHLLAQMFTLFLFVYVVLATIVWVLTPVIVTYAFPGFVGEMDTLVTLIRILLLQPLLLGMSSLFGVVTQLGHRFILYAVSPLLYNIGIIIGIIYFYPYLGLSGLAWGVVLGATAHFLVQVPLVQKSKLSFGLTGAIDWKTIWEVLTVSVPRAITLAMHQVTLLVLSGIASVMTAGSVAVFQFAYNLQSVPLAIIGVSYSTAAFPLLADLFAQKKIEAFRVHVTTALRHIIFWSLPVVAMFIVLRAQVVRVILGSGEFGWEDTRLTAASLAILTASLLAQAVNLLLLRVFYAGGLTRLPFLVTLFGSLSSVVFTGVLYVMYNSLPEFSRAIDHSLRITDVPGSEVVVIAIGYGIGIVLQSSLLLFLIIRTYSLSTDWLWPHVSRSLTASTAGAFGAYLALNIFAYFFNTDTFLTIFAQGLIAGMVGLILIIIAYYLLHSPELVEIYRSIRRRLFKSKKNIVVSNDDVL